ncbi:GYF domain-containing protein [bacterium]|jgi:TM2 domain-containing membrane protein YozV|nr:GYF domain-containing protein [bacterium]
MEDQWFYSAHGEPQGPVRRSDLQIMAHMGYIGPSDYVWSVGMADWVAAGDVEGLLDPPRPVVPPPPPTHPRLEEGEVFHRRIIASLCGVLFGGLGVHKFVMGKRRQGITMLLASLLTFFVLFPVMWIIGLIEGIIYLSKTDAEFAREYIDGNRGWF